MRRQPAHFTRRREILAACALIPLTLGFPGPTAQAASPRKLLILGDSLSAEYGLARGSGWVALLEQRMKQQGIGATVVNASISGETTSGGRTRLPGLLKQHQPTHVVIELGGNDALRGFPLRTTQDNLQAMVDAAQRAGAKVLVVGMQVPPNYGKRYAADFAGVFARVAQGSRVALVPFLLQGVADRPDAREWFQADGIHPLAKAHPVMLENVWRGLRPLL